jgi:hypothetical protein
VTLGFLVADAAGFGHEIDQNFIGNTNDGELFDITCVEFPHRAIGKRGQCLKNFHFVVGRRVNEQVDVAGSAGIPSFNNGKSTDHDIFGPQAVQFAAEADHVLLLRRSRDQLRGFVM